MQDLIRYSAEMGILLTEKDRNLFTSRMCRDRISQYQNLATECERHLASAELSDFHKDQLRPSVVNLHNMIKLLETEAEQSETQTDIINGKIASHHENMMSVCPHTHKDRWNGTGVSYDRCRACYQMIELPPTNNS